MVTIYVWFHRADFREKKRSRIYSSLAQNGEYVDPGIISILNQVGFKKGRQFYTSYMNQYISSVERAGTPTPLGTSRAAWASHEGADPPQQSNVPATAPEHPWQVVNTSLDSAILYIIRQECSVCLIYVQCFRCGHDCCMII